MCDISCSVVHCSMLHSYNLHHAIRSTLPQHFNTHDGHYEKGMNRLDCNQSKKWKVPDSNQPIQKYNNATDHAFKMYCSNIQQQSQSYYAYRYEHECTVNQTSTEYRTVYKYLKENNCTNRLERIEKQSTQLVTGTILRWNIAGECS